MVVLVELEVDDVVVVEIVVVELAVVEVEEVVDVLVVLVLVVLVLVVLLVVVVVVTQRLTLKSHTGRLGFVQSASLSQQFGIGTCEHPGPSTHMSSVQMSPSSHPPASRQQLSSGRRTPVSQSSSVVRPTSGTVQGLERARLQIVGSDGVPGGMHTPTPSLQMSRRWQLSGSGSQLANGGSVQLLLSRLSHGCPLSEHVPV